MKLIDFTRSVGALSTPHTTSANNFSILLTRQKVAFCIRSAMEWRGGLKEAYFTIQIRVSVHTVNKQLFCSLTRLIPYTSCVHTNARCAGMQQHGISFFRGRKLQSSYTTSPALRLCSLSQNRWCWLLFLQYDAFVCFHFQCPKHRKTHLSADFRTANVIALGSCTSQTLFLIECCSKCWLCTLDVHDLKSNATTNSLALKSQTFALRFDTSASSSRVLL